MIGSFKRWAPWLTALLPSLALAVGGYAEHPEALAFAQDLQARHGIDAAAVLATLGEAQRNERVLKLIVPPGRPGVRSWARYRARFIEPSRIEGGLAFWQENTLSLRQASEKFGVPEEVIVAIIGVETFYGRNTGNFRLLDALSTLAFDYPPRAALFQRELENLFLLARDEKESPTRYRGSYAGAIGYPQFLPSSIRNFAVDFDEDGHVDLEGNPADAIGSVANYLHRHGWEAGRPVAVRARLTQPPSAQVVAADILPSFGPAELAAQGIFPEDDQSVADKAALISLDSPGAPIEYWLGYQNFYVITRYNRSSFYAMAVFQLASALLEAQAPNPPQASLR